MSNRDITARHQRIDVLPNLTNTFYTEPEKRLMAAVLDSGLRDYLMISAHCSCGVSSKVRREEAEVWLLSESRSWPFDFVVICESLGIDAGALRTKMRQLAARTLRR